MKKVLQISLLAITVLALVFTAVACNGNGAEVVQDASAIASLRSDISSAVSSIESIDSLTIDNEKNILTCSVNHSVNSIDFSTLVIQNGSIRFFSDEAKEVAVTTADLFEGENTFYIIATKDDISLNYKLIVTRALAQTETPDPDHEHIYGGWLVVNSATCTTAGLRKKTCACGDEITETIAALGHDLIHHDAKEPTCGEVGYAGYDACSRCDYSTYNEIPATGNHTEVIDAAVPATCSQTGLTEGKHCSVCQTVLVAQVVLPRTEHIYGELIPEHPATCESAGHIAYYQCSNCKKYFNEQKQEVEETALLLPQNHVYGSLNAPVSATCTENGQKAYYQCSICNRYFDEDKIEMSADDLVIPASHTEVIDAAVPATCTESGLTEGKHCSVCESILEVQTEIPALGHDYSEVVTSPTCTEGGYITHTCSRCGDTYVDGERAATGHQFGSNGICSVCGASMPQTKGLVFTELDDGTYQVSGYTGIDKDLYIPSTYKDCPVTKIKPFAFAGAEITSIMIPDSVTSIGSGALMECSNLERITIPFIGAKARIAEDIAQYPFGYIFGSTNYEGSDEVKQKYDGDWIYYYVPSSLRTVIVTGGEIRENAFLNCAKLTSVTISGNVATLGANAFSGCSSLSSITFSDRITSIGSGTFNGCTSLIAVDYKGDISSWISISFATANANPLSCAHNLYINNSLVTELTIPEGTTEIKAYSFYGLKNVTSLVIPKSVLTIGNYAFTQCKDLTSLAFDEDSALTTIGASALSGCNALRTVTLPPQTESIGASAFSGCSALEEMTIPFVGGSKSAESASDSTLFGYLFGAYSYTGSRAVNQYYASSSYKTYYIPSSLCSVTVTGGNIPYGAFYGCSMLTSISISEGVTSIRDYAFYGCSGLASVTFAEGSQLASIGNYAFQNCSSLTSITIPDSVTSIGSDAFYYCSGLTSISGSATNASTIAKQGGSASYAVIITSGESIGDNAFQNCSGLTSITIPSSVTSIGSSAFQNCRGLTSVTFAEGSQLASIGSYAFSGCSASIIWGDNPTITAIGSYAFSGYKGTSITIPSSVTSIGERAFYNCSSLTSIYYVGDIVGWCGISGLGNLMSYGASSKSLYIGGTKVEELVIPSSVTSIGGAAFQSCSGLTSITIPESVTSIGGAAFQSCSGLTSIYYEGDIAGWCGISGLSNIMSSTRTLYIRGEKVEGDIVIPSTVTSIGSSAFSGCTDLTSITIPSSVTSIGSYAFSRCSGLTFVTIGSGVTSIGEYAFESCTGLTSITIPESVTSIESSAFSRCSGLTSITIPSSVTSIGRSAFYGCSSLEEMTIPFVGAVAGKTASDAYQYPFGYIFGASSYTGGTAVKQVYYGSSTISTTSSTYYIPTALRSVTVTGGNILYGAFYGCSMLTSITIPNSVTSIGSSAFYGCSSLEEMTIPFVGGSNFGYIFGTSSYTGGTAVTQYYRASSYVTYYIPSSLSSVTVTGGNILYGAFYGCSMLTSITISSSVTSIGSYAFYNCIGLTSVTISDSVTSIGSSAFSGCSGLTSISGSATSTATVAKQCGSASYAVIITSGESIGSSAFSGCSGLASVMIGSGVTSIGSSAFYNCSGLTSIYYEGDIAGWCGISGLGNLMPYGASTKSLYIGGAKVEGDLEIPSTVTSIGSSAFYGCSGLTSVTIPYSVTSIGYGAFAGCSSLVEMTIPFVGAVAGKTARDTYQYPFGYIFGTSSYTGGMEVRQYYYDSSTSSTTSTVYYIPSSLRSVTVTGGNILYGAFYGCSMLTSITIPNSVTSIGSYAFYNCIGLTSVTISDSVTSIESSAFSGCSGLTSITVEEGNAVYHNAGNCLIKTESKTVILGCKNSIIPSDGTVTSIGGSAFYYCSGLTSITIPDSVTSIGTSAFYNCSGLTSVIFAEGSQLTSIGSSAFSGCSGLTSITIPESVTSIGEYAFAGCSSLEEMTIPFVGGSNFGYIFGMFSYTGGTAVRQYYRASSYVTYYIPSSLSSVTVTGGNILYGAFYGCSMLTSISILEGVTSIGGSAFYNCIGLTSVTISDSVTSIGDWAFSGCSGLTSVTIGSGVTSIGGNAFSRCSGLTSVTFAEGSQLTSIGSDAFSGCSGLTSISGSMTSTATVAKQLGSASYTVTITSGESIGSSAFKSCSGLTSITIPEGVTSIESSAFSRCSGLTSITIPSSVTSIGDWAFYNCSSLTSVTFAEGSQLASIGSSAFCGCSSLEEMTIPFVGGSKSAESASNSTLFGYLFGSYSYTGGVAVKQYYSSSYYKIYYIPSSLRSVTVTGGNILYGAFYGCSMLTSITIPNSVTSIGTDAFYGCYKLVEVYNKSSLTITKGSSNYGYVGYYAKEVYTEEYVSKLSTDENGYILYTDGDNISLIGYSGSDTELTLPAEITEIYQYAFQNCSGLTSITIPSSVTSIGEYAFESCTGLTSVTFAEGSQLASIGSYAFSGCSASIIWGDNPTITAIGSYAFSGYKGTSITIPSSVTSIGSSAFYNCIGLTSVTISDSVTSIGNYAFYYCSGLTSVIFAEGSQLTSIGSSAFRNCSGLTSITIPESVTSIGSSAFYNCSSLTSVTFANTSGWFVFTSSYATSGTSVTVTDASTNATNLNSTYSNYYWKRN